MEDFPVFCSVEGDCNNQHTTTTNYPNTLITLITPTTLITLIDNLTLGTKSRKCVKVIRVVY